MPRQLLCLLEQLLHTLEDFHVSSRPDPVAGVDRKRLFSVERMLSAEQFASTALSDLGTFSLKRNVFNSRQTVKVISVDSSELNNKKEINN